MQIFPLVPVNEQDKMPRLLMNICVARKESCRPRYYRVLLILVCTAQINKTNSQHKNTVSCINSTKLVLTWMQIVKLFVKTMEENMKDVDYYGLTKNKRGCH